MFGSFLPPIPHLRPFPLPYPSTAHPLPTTPLLLALISNFVEDSINNNKKDKAFLLVEIRIAIQGDS
jgi:hypothetical protein